MGYATQAKRKKIRSDESAEVSNIVRSGFIGFGAGLIAALALWIIVSLIAYSNDDPDSVASALGFAAIYLACLFGGFVSVRINRGKALLCGSICGILMTLIFWVASRFFGADHSAGYSFVVEFLLRVAMIVMSLFGAFAALNRRKKRRR